MGNAGTNQKLTDKQCAPCEGGIEALKGEAIAKLTEELGGDWAVIEEHHLEKEYKFKDFAEALAFVNKVGDLAENLGHHPDIYLSWGKVKITLWTHKIGGLHENDFIFAAKTDKLYSPTS